MPPGALHSLAPWKRKPLVIPPDSPRTWIRLAVWEMWMGTLVCTIVGFGVSFIASSPRQILTFADLTRCYDPPPIPTPCEQIVYRGGLLNAAFTALIGVMLIGVALWFLWELWNACEPRPITDDFLKLLNDSFGYSWRNPLKWPWARVFWAYGFTFVGAVTTAGVALAIWTFVIVPNSRVPAARIETSQSFTVGR